MKINIDSKRITHIFLSLSLLYLAIAANSVAGTKSINNEKQYQFELDRIKQDLTFDQCTFELTNPQYGE